MFRGAACALAVLDCGTCATLGQVAAASTPAALKVETVTADVVDARQKEAAKAKELDDSTRARFSTFIGTPPNR